MIFIKTINLNHLIQQHFVNMAMPGKAA